MIVATCDSQRGYPAISVTWHIDLDHETCAVLRSECLPKSPGLTRHLPAIYLSVYLSKHPRIHLWQRLPSSNKQRRCKHPPHRYHRRLRQNAVTSYQASRPHPRPQGPIPLPLPVPSLPFRPSVKSSPSFPPSTTQNPTQNSIYFTQRLPPHHQDRYSTNILHSVIHDQEPVIRHYRH